VSTCRRASLCSRRSRPPSPPPRSCNLVGVTASRFAAALAVVGALLFPAILSAARGDLDPTFGTGGKVTTDFGGNETASGVAVQRDGKAVVGGTRFDMGTSDDFVLARYTVSGALDRTFDGDGKATTDFGGRADGAGDLVIQADGKIVAAGSGFPPAIQAPDFALARYNRDGTLDATFGDGGKVLTGFGVNSIDRANAVAVQADGKMVVAGSTRSVLGGEFALARYLPNGTLDPTFGRGGRVLTRISPADDTVFDLAVQPDGKLVAAGWSSAGGFDIAMARYNPDGSLDPSFDGDGMVIAAFRPASSYASNVVVQRDGKILTGGTGLVRFNPDGGVDRSFGAGGRAVTDLGLVKPVLQPDGKILAAGSSEASGQYSDFVVVRLTASGRIDSTFGRGGRVTTDFRTQDDATDATLLANGKLIVSGHTSQVPFEAGDFAVARYVAIRFCIVPNVRRKTLRAARAGLTKAWCKVGTVRRTYSARVGKGRVISQRPAPRTRLAELAKVNLVVSRGRRR
jgi:uncharacterized delta-60 repeat protein